MSAETERLQHISSNDETNVIEVHSTSVLVQEASMVHVDNRLVGDLHRDIMSMARRSGVMAPVSEALVNPDDPLGTRYFRWGKNKAGGLQLQTMLVANSLSDDPNRQMSVIPESVQLIPGDAPINVSGEIMMGFRGAFEVPFYKDAEELKQDSKPIDPATQPALDLLTRCETAAESYIVSRKNETARHIPRQRIGKRILSIFH